MKFSIDEGIKAPSSSKMSNDGVSTRYAQHSKSECSDNPRWYALRTTYGREGKAYKYIIEHGGTAFYPTMKIFRFHEGKHREYTVSRIPNVFFVRGTEEEVKFYAYDNIHLPFVRFYYAHKHEGVNIIKYPLIIPDKQIENLRILCNSKSSDTIIVPSKVKNFANGDLVRVVEGDFKGIEGRVSRWHGQQRVGIVIDGICTMATAYIPSAFLESIQ